MSEGNVIGVELASLFNELRALSVVFDDVTDTDVREAIGEVLNFYFVWGEPLGDEAISFRMLSQDGDAQVASIVRRFLRQTRDALGDVPVGQQRLDLLQDRAVRSYEGDQYDVFIGHLDAPRSLAPLSPSLLKR